MWRSVPECPSAQSPTCSTDPTGSASRPATRCNRRSASWRSSATNPDVTCGRGGAGRSATSASPSPIRSSRTSPGGSRRSLGATASPRSCATATATRRGRRTTSRCSSSSGCGESWSARSASSPSQFEQLRRRGITVVLVGTTLGADWCSAAVDDVVGGELAVSHLLEQGHRRIAFVGGVLDAKCVADRLVGAHKALAAAGRDADSLDGDRDRQALDRRRPASRRTAARPPPSPSPDGRVLRQRPRRPRAAPAHDAGGRRGARRAGDRRLRRHRVRRRGGRSAELGSPAPGVARPHRHRAVACGDGRQRGARARAGRLPPGADRAHVVDCVAAKDAGRARPDRRRHVRGGGNRAGSPLART